jgi:CheY-like chemotaxis protein
VTQPTVLVVEDDDDIRELTQLCLESVDGWPVMTARGGREAIESCRTQLPDVILLDLMMPEMDGLATFDQLQRDPRTRDIPVVLLTASGNPGAQQPWDGHRFSGVIAKPYDPMTLGRQVLAILQGRPA